MTTTPIPPEQQEEARRQAEAQASASLGDIAQSVADTAILADQAADLVTQGSLGAIADAAGSVLGATVDVAKAGIEAVGGLFGAIGDL